MPVNTANNSQRQPWVQQPGIHKSCDAQVYVIYLVKLRSYLSLSRIIHPIMTFNLFTC